MSEPKYSVGQPVIVKNGQRSGQEASIIEIIPARASDTWMYRLAFTPGDTSPYYEDELEPQTAPYMVKTIGLVEEIEAVSFQDAAQKMLEKHNLTSVASIELLDCRIVDGKLEYRTHQVIDVKDEAEEERERLDFLESGRAIEDQ